MKNKTIKIKCLKDPQTIEIPYFQGYEEILTEHWESMGRGDWYEIVEEE